MYYGIETTRVWLVKYTQKYWNHKDFPASNSVAINLNRAIELLERHSGARGLRIKTVIPIDTPLPPARKGTRQTLPLPKCGNPIVSICSSEHSSFHMRPSQVKVEALKQIMGGNEPQWWFDNVDRNWFESWWESFPKLLMDTLLSASWRLIASDDTVADDLGSDRRNVSSSGERK